MNKKVDYKKLPYFEMKIMKVKKRSISELQNTICSDCSLSTKERDRCIFRNCPKIKPKGNWVNGENLDKIKFPCFCSYTHALTHKKHYGKIDKTWDDIAYKEKYIISKVSNETINCIVPMTGDPVPELSVLYEDCSLEKLIINLNIHILKGIIIIFEEEIIE